MKLTEKKEVERLFHNGLAQLDLVLEAGQINSLVLYCLELRKWSRKVNLVAKDTSLADLVDKHFLDSLALVPLLERHGCGSGPLLDVGSGAGFPGLAVKIACPSLGVVLLEPRQRRVTFLRHIIRLLALEKIDVWMKRTDELDPETIRPFGVITGRAVADVAEFLRMVEHLAGPETLIVCMQGAGGMEKWKQQKEAAGFQCIGVEEERLPISRARRYFLLFRKS